MPYIDQDTRRAFDGPIRLLQLALKQQGGKEGNLNYVITRLVADAFQQEPRYHTIARICGVLGNVADEFYRRVAGPYEDKAIQKNGDVPEYS